MMREMYMSKTVKKYNQSAIGKDPKKGIVGHNIPTKKVKSTDLTLDQFKGALPKHLKPNLTEKHMDSINKILASKEGAEGYRDNLLTHTNVLSQGRYKLETYIDAVRYVSCKLMGATNISAYIKTFPDRYQHYIDIGSDELHIHSVCSAFNRNQLVNKIMEQTLIPTHVLNADLHQKAINQLAYLMMNARSEKVQSDSAAKLVDALKIPETVKMELDIGIKEDDSIKELRQTTMELVKQQKLAIEVGTRTAKEIAHSKIVRDVIDVKVIEK